MRIRASRWTELSAPSLSAVAECLRLDAARPDRLRTWLSEAPDVARIVPAAQRLAVLPAVAWVVTRADLWRFFDVAAREELEHESMRAAAANGLLLYDAAEVAARLAEVEIETLFIKGAALLADVYPGVGARHLDDIDVVVPRQRAREAYDRLLEAGFRVEERFDGQGFDGRPLVDHNATENHSEVGLLSPAGTAVDIHRHMAEQPADDLEVLSAGAQIVSLPTGGEIRVPAPAVAMRILCEHVVRHHDAVLRYWPRHLADIGALERRYGAAAWASDRNGSVACSRWVYDRAVRDPHAASWALAPSPALDRRSESGARALRVLDRAARHLVDDPGVLARKFVPTRGFIAELYGTTPDDPKLPLLYAHRLVTLRFVRVAEGA